MSGQRSLIAIPLFHTLLTTRCQEPFSSRRIFRLIVPRHRHRQCRCRDLLTQGLGLDDPRICSHTRKRGGIGSTKESHRRSPSVNPDIDTMRLPSKRVAILLSLSPKRIAPCPHLGVPGDLGRDIPVEKAQGETVAFAFGSRKAEIASKPAATQIHASATLNDGQTMKPRSKLRKSTT